VVQLVQCNLNQPIQCWACRPYQAKARKNWLDRIPTFSDLYDDDKYYEFMMMILAL